MTPPLRLVIQEYAGETTVGMPAPPPLGEVHIWHWAPVCPPSEVDELWNILAENERERAQRYRFPKHRNEFVINRARVRGILARYVAKAPQDLVFEYSPHGKPSLEGVQGWRFNLSHTEGLAALAVVQGREIGIDVERIRPQSDARRIAERFFSVPERQSLQAFSGDALDHAFFRCWTRKECYIKAKGEGLSLPLHQFDVSLGEGEPAMLLSTRPDPKEAEEWVMYDLALKPGYAAALAVSADLSSVSQ